MIFITTGNVIILNVRDNIYPGYMDILKSDMVLMSLINIICLYIADFCGCFIYWMLYCGISRFTGKMLFSSSLTSAIACICIGYICHFTVGGYIISELTIPLMETYSKIIFYSGI